MLKKVSRARFLILMFMMVAGLASLLEPASAQGVSISCRERQKDSYTDQRYGRITAWRVNVSCNYAADADITVLNCFNTNNGTHYSNGSNILHPTPIQPDYLDCTTLNGSQPQVQVNSVRPSR